MREVFRKMSKAIIHICDTLYTIRLSFSGIAFFESTFKEKDFYNLDIPSIYQDRKNLKNDRSAVSNDLVKSVEAKNKLLTA